MCRATFVDLDEVWLVRLALRSVECSHQVQHALITNMF